jgi:diacylglycerol kinase family enzyme
MPKGLLIVNPRSGSGGTSELLAAAAERGIATHVLRAGEDVPDPGDAEVLGCAGGDGTLGAVAGVALARGLPFVCVPFGTRNHFARDLGLGDSLAALAAFSSGVPRVIDVGRVGHRVFLNNVSIGAYAQFVHRVRQRRLHLTIDDAPVRARVVLFANNAYRLNGVRERLDSGSLHLYVAHGLLRPSWEERVAMRFTVAGARKIAIDGEAVHVDSPFEVSIEPRALTVLVPGEGD